MAIALGEKLSLYRRFLILLTRHAGPHLWHGKTGEADKDAEQLAESDYALYEAVNLLKGLVISKGM